MRRAGLGLCVFLLIVYGLGRVGLSIANESVFVWRVFHRNLAVCGPFLSSEQERKFLAAFGSMERRADFNAIRAQLDALAQKNGVLLQWQK